MSIPFKGTGPFALEHGITECGRNGVDEENIGELL